MAKKIIVLLLCLAALFALTSCGEKGVNVSDEPQYYEGGVGDTMETYFFDFTVNSAHTSTTYGDVELDEGCFLIVNVTVKNTMSSTITMVDTDFQAQWTDESDDAYCFPITYEYEDGLLDEMRQLPASYDLESGKSRNGELVYVVPADEPEYSISYQELLVANERNESEGDVFFVYFTPEQ